MLFTSFNMDTGNSVRFHTADKLIVLDKIQEIIGLYIKTLDGLEL